MNIRTLSKQLESALAFCSVGICITAIAVYLYIALRRLAFPFALEWLEGNTFLHVLRVLQGKPIYVAPSFDFIPMIYTPLYYYTAAFLANFTGNIMQSMRVVSTASSLFAFAAIYGICRARQLPPSIATLSVGLFAAAYGLIGFWFDIGRVDTLSVALMLIGLYFGIATAKTPLLFRALSAICLWLAFLAKQQSIIAAPLLFVYIWLHSSRKHALVFAAITVILLIGALLILNFLSAGWFWLYTFDLVTASPFSITMALRVAVIYIVRYYFPSIIGWIIAIIISRVSHKRINWPILLIVLPLISMSELSLAKVGGYRNGLMPACAGMALLAGEAAHQLITNVVSKTWLRVALQSSALLLVLGQTVLLKYDATGQIPSPDQLAAGQSIVARLRHLPEPIFAPTASYLLYLADKAVHYHISSLADLAIAAQSNPKARAIYEQNMIGIQNTLVKMNTALLPNVNWYDAQFDGQHHYECINLIEQHQKLITVTGAVSYLDKLCQRQ